MLVSDSAGVKRNDLVKQQTQRRACHLLLQEKQVGSDSVPGKEPGIKSRVLEMGTSLLQKFAPTKKISQHVCAFHFYAHDMTRQVGTCLPLVLPLLLRHSLHCRADLTSPGVHGRGASLLLLRQRRAQAGAEQPHNASVICQSGIVVLKRCKAGFGIIQSLSCDQLHSSVHPGATLLYYKDQFRFVGDHWFRSSKVCGLPIHRPVVLQQQSVWITHTSAVMQ